MRFAVSWIGVLGQPGRIRMDEGGAWKNKVRTDLCSERRIILKFQGADANPWIRKRLNGIARGIYNRWAAADRFPGKQILSEPQRRLNTRKLEDGYSANQRVFGSNPVDLSKRADKGEDFPFAQETSSPG